jgi:hypothetical protein
MFFDARHNVDIAAA